MKSPHRAWLLAFWAASLLVPLACTRGLLEPSRPSSTANILSAFITLGSAAAFYNDEPTGIQYSNHHLWLCNYSTNLQEWSTSGSAALLTIWTYGAGTSFTQLYGNSIDPVTGNVYVCDQSNYQGVVFDPAGNYLAVFGAAQLGPTAGNPGGSVPTGVAVNSSGTTVYVAGMMTDSLYAYSIGGTASLPTYSFQFSFGSAGSGAATLNYPTNLRVDGQGNLWVADEQNHRIAEYTGSGSYLGSFQASSGTSQAFTPVDVLVDPAGNVYGVDTVNGVVAKFNSSGQWQGQFGQGILKDPQGITTDGTGDFYVTQLIPQQIVGFH